MREFGSSPLSLAGSLLIAHPSLLDPNFCKTVLLLSASDPDDGSFGVVLNRPSGRTVADVLPGKKLGKLGHAPVLVGGPVSSDQLMFASFLWHPADGRMTCRYHLEMDEAQVALSEEYTVVRAFIGYSGWSKGQLEAELAQHAWLVGQPDREILGIGRTASLWRDTISPFGPWFQLVAEAPEDISRN